MTNEELQKIDLSTLVKVADGKTKTFYAIPNDPENVLMVQKDILSVGNGETIISVPEIGELKALQNDAIQKFWARHGIPTSYKELIAPNRAVVKKAEMIALEMVERNDSAKNGSWAERNPNAEFPKGQIVSEMFDKRTIVAPPGHFSFLMDEKEAFAKYGKNPETKNFLHADPYVIDGYIPLLKHINMYVFDFYDQHKPIAEGNRLMRDSSPYSPKDIDDCKKYSLQSFGFLTQGLKMAGKKLGIEADLIDDKTEYGHIASGVHKTVVLSDDMTADAFRLSVKKDGVAVESSKQVFRDLMAKTKEKVTAENGSYEELTDKQTNAAREIMPKVYERTTEIIKELDGITL